MDQLSACAIPRITKILILVLNIVKIDIILTLSRLRKCLGVGAVPNPGQRAASVMYPKNAIVQMSKRDFDIFGVAIVNFVTLMLVFNEQWIWADDSSIKTLD